MEIHKTFHDCLPNLCSNAITGKCVASGYEGVLDDRDQILELHHKRLSYLVQICLVMVALSGSAYIPYLVHTDVCAASHPGVCTFSKLILLVDNYTQLYVHTVHRCPDNTLN